MTEYAPDELVVPQLLVPAYFHPAVHPRDWERLAECAAQIRLIILNLADGPGGQADEVMLPALDQVRAAGITVCGYIDTNYGQRPADAAIADLRLYLRWYRVGGVFFDRVATTAELLRHYADLARQARDGGAQLIAFNHGAYPTERYADHADLLGTFEGPWSAYLDPGVPHWVRSRPAGQFFHLVHSVPTASFADARWLAARRHAGCAYITDRGGANPWDGLPSPAIGQEKMRSSRHARDYL